MVKNTILGQSYGFIVRKWISELICGKLTAVLCVCQDSRLRKWVICQNLLQTTEVMMGRSVSMQASQKQFTNLRSSLSILSAYPFAMTENFYSFMTADKASMEIFSIQDMKYWAQFGNGSRIAAALARKPCCRTPG